MTASSISLSYGRGHMAVALPEGAVPTIVRKRPLAKIADPLAAIEAAFANPIGSPPLAELARGRRSACIVICDITRPVPNGLFLGPMLRTLLAAGIPQDRIDILIATGLHRPNLGDEMAELVGDPWVLANFRVQNHDARDEAAHIDLGPTPTRGTPVKLDRVLVEADLRIATGLVEPHFMAGWSGGRKVIAPGVAHHETIRTFHSARFMADPLAVQCNLIGNPLHEEQLEIVKRLGEVHALNTVLDEERDLVCVTFGEIIASHAAAVDFAGSATRIALPHKFSTLVTSSAGYPLDKTYYQTIKGMVTPLDILAPGGTLIMVSECSEGFGSPEFRDAQARLVELGPDRFLATLTAKSLAEIDEWQSQMQLKPMRAGRVELFTTGLAGEDLRLTGVHPIDDVTGAIAGSIARSGDPRVAVIPEGPYVIPYAAA